MADQDQNPQAETPSEMDIVLGALKQVADQQQEIISKLNDHDEIITELSTRPAVPEGVAPPELVEEILPQAPEGKTRFRSPHAEYKIVVEPRHPVEAGGRVLPANQPMIEFHGGICDATEDQAEFLRANPAYGEDYWEDPHATALSVSVQTGPRHSGRPTPPPRPEGRLVARL